MRIQSKPVHYNILRLPKLFFSSGLLEEGTFGGPCRGSNIGLRPEDQEPFCWKNSVRKKPLQWAIRGEKWPVSPVRCPEQMGVPKTTTELGITCAIGSLKPQERKESFQLDRSCEPTEGKVSEKGAIPT